VRKKPEATMQLLVIRHAIAEDKKEFAATGRPDGERPLTKRGQKEMRKVAAGLRRQVKSLDVLAASPLVRAQQTAAIVAAEYGDIFVETAPALEPDRSMMSFAKWLATVKRARVVAIVGHEPHLGTLVTWLMTGVSDSHLSLDKGGACLLEIEGKAAPRSATLCWALTPDLLRKLARR
jgi:phosphohistidine phosphatase